MKQTLKGYVRGVQYYEACPPLFDADGVEVYKGADEQYLATIQFGTGELRVEVADGTCVGKPVKVTVTL